MQKSTNLNNVVALENVTKRYGAELVPAVEGVSFQVAKEELVCIVGPSGCGKSTILKMIAGLEKPTSGQILKPDNVAMVFQSGALLPWLTVFDNVALPLKEQHLASNKVTQTVLKYLAMTGLSEFEQKYPRELSGGQRQRVGIARALAVSPELLLLDEPFSALDPKTTEELHQDVIKIWKETRQTIIMVSHLIEEAVSLASRVILMRQGKMEKIYPIDLPRPRREQEHGFAQAVQDIRREFFR